MTLAAKQQTKSGGRRSAARLGAVQALYQHAMAGNGDTDALIKEFLDHRLGQEMDGETYAPADKPFFVDLVRGASADIETIRDAVASKLSDGWKIERLDRLLFAILRAGAYELKARPDIPTAVIINEYVDVAHAFYEGGEPAFVNSVLDKLAAEFRG